VFYPRAISTNGCGKDGERLAPRLLSEFGHPLPCSGAAGVECGDKHRARLRKQDSYTPLGIGQEIEVGLMGDNPRLDPIHRGRLPPRRAEGAPPSPLRLSNFGPTSCGLRPRRQPNPFISSPITKTP
jgi:hypothetical protein